MEIAGRRRGTGMATSPLTPCGMALALGRAQEGCEVRDGEGQHPWVQGERNATEAQEEKRLKQRRGWGGAGAGQAHSQTSTQGS